MIDFLTELENTADSSAMSLFLPTGISRPEVEQLVEKMVSSAGIGSGITVSHTYSTTILIVSFLYLAGFSMKPTTTH